MSVEQQVQRIGDAERERAVARLIPHLIPAVARIGP